MINAIAVAVLVMTAAGLFRVLRFWRTGPQLPSETYAFASGEINIW
jgi:hypothetical protein